MNRAVTQRLSALGLAGLVSLSIVACGGEKTDVSGGVDKLNQTLAAGNVELDCPKTVDGGEGTTFDCTVKSKQGGGKEAKVKLKVVKQGGDLAVDIDDQAAFGRAIQQVRSQ